MPDWVTTAPGLHCVFDHAKNVVAPPDLKGQAKILLDLSRRRHVYTRTHVLSWFANIFKSWTTVTKSWQCRRICLCSCLEWKYLYSHRWSLNSGLVAESIGNLKGRMRLMHANYCNMPIDFHEKWTILKWKTKRLKRPLKQLISLISSSNETPHDKTNKMSCTPSEDSDQPGHPPNLIRVFAVHMKKV